MQRKSSSPDRPIKRETLREAVRDAVIERVLAGTLTAGERVNETALARELGVSVTPVREALLGLERESYFKRTPGKGFVVSSFRAQEVSDIYSVLGMLEGLALRSSKSLKPETVVHLRNINEEFRLLGDNVEAAIQANIRWHETLVSECTNVYLMELIRKSRRAVNRYECAFLNRHLDTESSADQHAAIIDAIERGDLEEAAVHLQANWRSNISRVRSSETMMEIERDRSQ